MSNIKKQIIQTLAGLKRDTHSKVQELRKNRSGLEAERSALEARNNELQAVPLQTGCIVAHLSASIDEATERYKTDELANALGKLERCSGEAAGEDFSDYVVTRFLSFAPGTDAHHARISNSALFALFGPMLKQRLAELIAEVHQPAEDAMTAAAVREELAKNNARLDAITVELAEIDEIFLSATQTGDHLAAPEERRSGLTWKF